MTRFTLAALWVVLAVCAIHTAQAAHIETKIIATSKSDIQAYLNGHNHERAKHGAKPLHWDESLAHAAQKWANRCKFEHSKGKVGPYGENLAAGTGPYKIADAIGGWNAEASQYNPKHPQYSHWTQVVWKSTTHVGCAVQTCNGIFDAKYGPANYYVCEYSPPGNYAGQFPKNVG
ncbi:PR-1-like protein [Leucogyrophana mollusca]|uniref:PR-1-like protein n=1 Tax=Leucogyrophana mollusca TaxID=85980 RepID=A0ACB8BJY0_9AGAM|nr:PR-1-like protein [Leucogyrophana mollusca]